MKKCNGKEEEDARYTNANNNCPTAGMIRSTSIRRNRGGIGLERLEELVHASGMSVKMLKEVGRAGATRQAVYFSLSHNNYKIKRYLTVLLVEVLK